jgi:hypothetical protein
MKYKIGDKVRVKSLDWYNNNTSNADFICCSNFIPFTQHMSLFCGCVLTIKSIERDNIYLVEENLNAWTEDMFEGLADSKENIEIILNDKKYIIDVEKAKELGVLKEKDSRCKSWEEFKLKYKGTRGYYYNPTNGKIYNPLDPWGASEQITQQDAIEIQAFSKLLKLRRDWIGEWNPDWSKSECKLKYCIVVKYNSIIINPSCTVQHLFSFPTEEMALEFLNCFRNLFEQCRNLI